MNRLNFNFIRPTPRQPIMDFQDELEYQFMLDCNPEDIHNFSEARNCYKYLQKSRKRVNKIISLTRKVYCTDD